LYFDVLIGGTTVNHRARKLKSSAAASSSDHPLSVSGAAGSNLTFQQAARQL
jgi:hypothetical protein